MNNALYIDKLTYQELGSRSAKVLTQNALDEKKIAKVLSLISQPESVKLVVKSHAHFAPFCSEISLTTAG